MSSTDAHTATKINYKGTSVPIFASYHSMHNDRPIAYITISGVPLRF